MVVSVNMWYALLYFPDLNDQSLDDFRNKYDITYPWIREHMPLLFPTPDSIGQNRLERHISRILMDLKPFQIHFNGLFKSWDHWLFLTVSEGYDRIVKLHDKIYTDILKPYLRSDIPFEPHLGLGLFAELDYDPMTPQKVGLKKDLYEHAFREAEALDFNFRCRLDRLTLIKASEIGKEIKYVKEYYL